MAQAEARVIHSLSRKHITWAALAGLIATHIILATLLFDPKPFIGGDNAGYMILAESIGSGQGYRDLYLPGAPRHAQYPPLYPTLLAIVRLFGGGLITFKILSLVLTSASLVFIFLLARSRLDSVVALSVVAPVALNPVLLYYSHWVLSEGLFVLLTLMALWASERMTGSWRWLGIALLAALLAYLTRAAGLPMLAALAVALLWRRAWRRSGVVVGVILLVVGAWWIWGKLAASESAQMYSSNLLLVDPYRPDLGYVGPGDLVARVVNNVRLYSIEVLPESLAGVAPGGGVSLVAILAGLLLAALALVAWVRDVRKVRPLEIFTLFYAGLIFLWPQVWTDRRFLLPLLPVLILYGAAGIVWCFDVLRARRPLWALPVLGVLLALLTVPDHVRGIGFNQRCQGFYRQGDDLACYPPPWRAFVQVAYWVGANTTQDVIVVSRKPRLFYHFSGRRGDVYPFTAEEGELLAFLDGLPADYVVVGAISATEYRYLIPAIRSMPERFELVHSVGEGQAAAYVLAYRRSVSQGS